jgi:hypothetical protein
MDFSVRGDKTKARHQVEPTAEDLSDLQATVQLAQEMGENLVRDQVLLGPLSTRQSIARHLAQFCAGHAYVGLNAFRRAMRNSRS